jgi:hypothetical protein
MTNASVLEGYVSALDTLLIHPSAKTRSRSDESLQGGYDETQLTVAELALPKSQAMQVLLEEQWQNASTAFERSVAEVQLLGMVAADLAIAERLVYNTTGWADDASTVWRSDFTGGSEALIKRAITTPEKLLAAEKLISYRVGEWQELLAATFECLRFVRYETIVTCGDAVTNLLTVDIALLKKAARIARIDIDKPVDKILTRPKKIAEGYVVAAMDKLDALIGIDVVSRVKESAVDFILESQENILVGRVVDKFLDTDAIYEESKGWIRAYEGDEEALRPTAALIGALHGSFRGRIRIANIVIAGLSVVRLFSPLVSFPWGPLGMTSAFLSVIGYVLFSAHDHVDSDRYVFFDRVQGVRSTLISELNISGTSV